MDNEDAQRRFHTAADNKGLVIGGVNSLAYPEEFAKIAIESPGNRAPLVEDFYRREFWNQWYAQLNSDEVAKRVFDMAVNAGPGTAVRLLQRAIDSQPDVEIVAPVQEDGSWGPKTVATANKCAEADLVEEFKTARITYYRAIVAKNPANQKYLAGWLARASK